METTVTIKITADKNDWRAVIAEEREGAKVTEARSFCFDTMPEDFGKALESYLDWNVLTPMARKLPLRSYTYLPTERKIGRIDRFCSGYYDTSETLTAAATAEDIEQFVAMLNKKEGVTPAQAKAMEIGSMFGWGCPGADPENYNEDGTPKHLCDIDIKRVGKSKFNLNGGNSV